MTRHGSGKSVPSLRAAALRLALAGVCVALLWPGPAAADEPASASPYDSLENRIISRVDIAGYHVTKEYVIRREIALAPGMPYSRKTMEADLKRLENLSIFSSVNVTSSTDSAGIALEYNVREMPWLIPAIALSYTEQNGWSAGPSVSTLNLAGRDIAVGAKVLVGGSTNFSANISYPWITGNHVGIEGVLAHLTRDDKLNEFQEKSTEVTPQLLSYIGTRGRMRGMYSSLTMRSDVDGKTLSPENVDHLHRIGGAIGYDSRNSFRDPTQGWWLELEGIRTGGWLRGDGDFWTGNLDLRRYQPALIRHMTLLSVLLSLQSGDVGTDIPEYLQYRMGGANSVRGYDIDVLGKEQYGKNQLIGTLEYQIPVVDLREFVFFGFPLSLGLKFAIFADDGIAWTESEQFGIRRSSVGTGVGLRILVPGVDVFRLDFAWAEGGQVRFHLASKPKPVAQRNRVR